MGTDKWRRGARRPPASASVAHRTVRPASRRIAWLSVGLWIGIIQSLGGDVFSSSETSRFLGPLLRWLFPDSGAELLSAIQFAIRKAAHFVEYGILALLWLRAWRLSFDGPQRNAVLASVAMVVAVAAVDEWRQAQSADRTGATSDVFLDTLGGVSALVGARLATRWQPR